jgi:predicted ABC-type sugar transport system permease subunit
MNLLQGPGGSLTLLVVVTIGASAVLIAAEASQLGMGKFKDSRGKVSTGPIAWFVLTCLLWIVAFPWYLHQRRYFGRNSLAVGGLLVALVFTGSSYLMGQAIEEKMASLSRLMPTLP